MSYNAARESAKREAWQKQQQRFVSALDRMRRDGKMTDANLICGDKVFGIHRNVLAASSPYFEAMFASGMKESLTGEIILKEVSPEAIQTMLQFMYTGEIADIGCMTDLKELIQMSHMMQIEPLFAYYMQELEMMIDFETCIEVWRVIQVYGSEMRLQEQSIQLMYINFSEILMKSDYLNLTCEELKVILKDAPFKADKILQGIIAWVKFSEEERRDKLDDLTTSLVNLDEVGSAHLEDLINDTSLMGTNQLLSTKWATKLASRINTEIQLPKSKEPKILYFGYDNFFKSMLSTFDINGRRWSAPVKLSFPFNDAMALAAHEGHIYLFGYLDQSHCNNLVETTIYKYSPVTNTATPVGNLKVGICYAGAGLHRGLVYIVAGQSVIKEGDGKSQMEKVKTVQCFDPSTCDCIEVASTVDFHCRPFVFEANNEQLHAFSSGDIANSLERYDPLVNQWTVITRVPYTLGWPSYAQHRGELVVCLGNDKQNDFCKYNFENNSWSDLQLSNKPKSAHYLLSVHLSDNDETLFALSAYKVYTTNKEMNAWMCISKDMPSKHMISQAAFLF